MAAVLPLFRSLLRVQSRLRTQPLLWEAIYNGVVRRTSNSQRLAALQVEAIQLVDLRQRFDEGSSEELDAAFSALRTLGNLLGSLQELESDGAYQPMQRSAQVRYVIGQRLHHERLGACVPYGWDPSCRAVEPPNAAALERAGGAAGVVDNRKVYVGMDAADREQPFYRVQLADGRGHYCAQSLLRPVPLSESFKVPIKGTSFFFTAADRESGCLIPRPELARRYPGDVALVRSKSGDRSSGLMDREDRGSP